MDISNKIWWTRKSRIQTEKRLLSDSFQSQLLLLWYSFFSVSASIFFLGKSPSHIVEVSWVSFSILIMVMSSFSIGLSFKERAFLVKECYESLNTLYHRAKRDKLNQEKIWEEYESIMGLCENHLEEDYCLALCLEYMTIQKDKRSFSEEDGGLDRRPLPIHWWKVVSYKSKRYARYCALYSLPFAIFVFIFFYSS